jgi:hypothetical protein
MTASGKMIRGAGMVSATHFGVSSWIHANEIERRDVIASVY